MNEKITCKCCNETLTREEWRKEFNPKEWNSFEDFLLYLQSG